MKPDTPIYSKESDNLKALFEKLISRHNVLCAIEQKFYDNPTAYLFFETARQEVMDSGNASLASMFTIAINSMADQLQDFLNGDDYEPDKLQQRIRELESENRKLKAQLSRVETVIREIGL